MKVVNIFHYLKVGVAFLLAFVGVKLLFHGKLAAIGFTSAHSLYVILGTIVLCISVFWSTPRKTYFLRSFTRSIKLSKRNSVSVGPPDASG